MGVKVVPVVYERPNAYGDFTWMVEHQGDHALYLFNDNVEYHYTCQKGRGNALMRVYNRYSGASPPRSAGIPTGYMLEKAQPGFRGFKVLDDHARDVIDKAFGEIELLMATFEYHVIYYSATSADDPTLGNRLFDVSREVLEYITERIHALEQ